MARAYFIEVRIEEDNCPNLTFWEAARCRYDIRPRIKQQLPSIILESHRAAIYMRKYRYIGVVILFKNCDQEHRHLL